MTRRPLTFASAPLPAPAFGPGARPYRRIDHWALTTLPPTVHTSAYTRALLARGHRVDPAPRPLLTDTTERRYVLAELALRTPLLSGEDLAALHRYVAALDRLAHVQVRVLGADTDQYLHTGFELSPTGVRAEGAYGPVPVHDPPTSTYQMVFDRLWRHATPYPTWYAARPGARRPPGR